MLVGRYLHLAARQYAHSMLVGICILQLDSTLPSKGLVQLSCSRAMKRFDQRRYVIVML